VARSVLIHWRKGCDKQHVALHGNGEQVHEGAALWNRGNTIVGIYGRWEGGKGLGSSRIDLGLITSVDAIHFSEPDPNFVFATPSPRGNWDSGGVLQGQGFQNIGGRTYFWYGSWDLTSSGDKFDAAADLLKSHGEIGLLTLRQDGFGYLALLDPKLAGADDTFYTGIGSLLTAPFRLMGGGARIFANVDGVGQGGFAAELLDSGGRVIPGWDFENFLSLGQGSLRQPLAWRNQSVVPEGGPYRLRVRLAWKGKASPRLYALYVSSVASVASNP
jgi:hypothetical protein